MDKEFFNQVKKLEIVAHQNLFIRSWNEDGVEIRYPSKDYIDIENNDGELEIHSRVDCLISAPKELILYLENVRKNCKISGQFQNVTIEYVGGNLEIESLDLGVIEKVGGNLKIGEVSKSITIEKVGGNFALVKNNGGILCEKIGGDFIANGISGGLDCSVGGNIVLSNTNFVRSSTSLKAGGNIKISYVGAPNFHLEAKSGGGYHIELGKDTFKGIYRTLDHVFGSGEPYVNLRAGGSIKINVKTQDAIPEIHFMQPDDLSWNELERKIESKQTIFDDFSIPDMNFLDNHFEDEIIMKTQVIESQIQKAMEKLDKKFVNNFDVFTNLGSHQKRDASEQQPKPVKNPVSNEEKMMILKMLQDKKITAEEADRLLNTLEQS